MTGRATVDNIKVPNGNHGIIVTGAVHEGPSHVHRALSWLERAEQCDDVDARFIFLWIAFNAAYANEIGNQERPSEQKVFGAFLKKLLDLEKDDGALYHQADDGQPGYAVGRAHLSSGRYVNA